MPKQKTHTKYERIFYPLAFLVFVLPYGPFSSADTPIPFALRFVLATLALIIIAVMFFKKDWITVFGFPNSPRQIITCLLAGIVAFLVFYFFIDFVLSGGGYQLSPPTESRLQFFGKFPWLARTVWGICQPLNEEIVLRALLLGFFARFFSHRAYLALLASLIFSGLHLLLYYFGSLATPLEVLTLLTLFFFALAANALYLTFSHIGFGLVIHMAWNWWRFSGNIVKDGIILNEAQGFNALEGSVPVFVFVAALSLACIVGLVIHDAKRKSTVRASNLTHG